MSGKPILIAALSGRALAQSARRAGYTPLVVDAFGDRDTREAAAAVRCIPSAMTRDIEPESLLAALEELARETTQPPLGVVFGAGFGDDAGYGIAIHRRFRLLGTSWGNVIGAKEPDFLTLALERLGIPYPETSTLPPSSSGWLVKPIGGSGGIGIRRCRPGRQTAQGCYFQRFVEGAAVSVLAVASVHGMMVIGMSRQWTSPAPRRPFRYGGAAGPTRLDGALAPAMLDAAARLCLDRSLIGLVSFDFIVSDHGFWLIEINPRPGATLDVFDDDAGSLFSAHMEACLGTAPLAQPSSPHVLPGSISRLAPVSGEPWMPGTSPGISLDQTRPPRAAAYLYADRGMVRIPAIDWPAWSADRPAPGTVIRLHDPIATVFADGHTDLEAEALCRKRLGLLSEMLYDRARMEGA